MIKEKIQRFLRDDRTVIAIFCFILLSIAVMVVESVATGDRLLMVMRGINCFCTVIFVVELLARWYVAVSFKHFLKYCWIDILALLPAIRAFRLLRLLRLLRLVNWGLRARRQQRLKSFGTLFVENMAVVVIPLFVVVTGTTVAILRIEGSQDDFSTAGKSIFWSISTLMAGEPIYGEPSSLGGKVVTLFLMIASFTLFALFTGVVSSVIMRMVKEDVCLDAGLLKSLSGHIVICGWGPVSPVLLEELRAAEDTRSLDLVVLSSEKVMFDLPPQMNAGELLFVKGDYTSAEMLKLVGTSKARSTVFLSEGSGVEARYEDARTVLAALTTEKLLLKEGNNGDKAFYTCVELLEKNEDKSAILQAALVDDVIEGHEFLGHFIAHGMMVDGLAYILEDLMTSCWGGEFKIIPAHTSGSFSELFRSLRNGDDQTLIGFGAGDNQFLINPDRTKLIAEGAPLLVVDSAGGASNSTNANHEIIKKSAGRAYPKLLVVCGYNRSIPHLLQELQQHPLGHNLSTILVSEFGDIPPVVQPFVDSGFLSCISGDYTTASVLRAAHIEEADMAVIASDEQAQDEGCMDCDARAVLTALTIEKHNPTIRTCVELQTVDAEKESILQAAGVEMVCGIRSYLGSLIAQSVRSPGLAGVLGELLTANNGNEFCKEAVDEAFVGMSFGDVQLNLMELDEKIAVGFRRSLGEGTFRYITNPLRTVPLEEGDELYFIVC